MEPGQNPPVAEIPKPHSPIAIKRRDLNTHWRLQRGSPASPMSMDFAPTPPRNQSETEITNNSEDSSPEWEQSRHTAVVTTRSSPRIETTAIAHAPYTQNTRDFLGRQMLQQYEEAERAQQGRHNARGPQYPHQFYAYAYDRGNGRYTRLIPADMLPPLVGVPAYESDISRLFVLELPQALDANGRNTNVDPVQTQVVQKDAVQSQIDQIVLASNSPAATNTSLTHHQSAAVAAYLTPPPLHGQGPKRAKIFCDKWVHEGTCAFTQQGCKYKHEMPYDRATQHMLGLFHGLPAWYKRQQAELMRQRQVLTNGDESSTSKGPMDLSAIRGGPRGRSLTTASGSPISRRGSIGQGSASGDSGEMMGPGGQTNAASSSMGARAFGGGDYQREKSSSPRALNNWRPSVGGSSSGPSRIPTGPQILSQGPCRFGPIGQPAQPQPRGDPSLINNYRRIEAPPGFPTHPHPYRLLPTTTTPDTSDDEGKEEGGSPGGGGAQVQVQQQQQHQQQQQQQAEGGGGGTAAHWRASAYEDGETHWKWSRDTN
ncbi:hypothetical protein QBC45DRAFT_335681 [Copromyces sp. CBS 386.78]|nr:hypothetical protein QBC45DRAFT_335681 [Copromyces sp. CBS 386.78]